MHLLERLIYFGLVFTLPLWSIANSGGGAQEINSQETSPESKMINDLLDQSYELVRTDLHLAKAKAKQAYELALLHHDYALKLKATRFFANTMIRTGEHADALILFEGTLQSMNGDQRNGFSEEVMMLYNNIAGVYYYLGDYKRAIDGFSEAMRFANTNQDSVNEAKCLQNLGACFQRLKKFDIAEDYFHKSLDLKILLLDSVTIPSTYLSLSTLVMQKRKDSEQAFQYIDEAEKICRLLGDQVQLGNVLYSRATVYMELENWERTEEELNRSYLVAKETNAQLLKGTILSVLGNCRVNTGDYAGARSALEQSLEIAKGAGLLDNQEYIYYWLSQAHEKEGHTEAALSAFKEYESVKDSLRKTESETISTRMETRYKVKQFREETALAQLEKEEALADRNKIILLSSLLIALVILIGWRETRLQRQRKLLLEAKLELNQKEINAGKQRLKAYADSLREKNALIDDLETKMRSEPTEVIAFDELLQMKILTDDDWKQFQILFSQVYPNFITRLRRLYPQMTMGEQRLILLLKLNMTNKEIADIIGVSGQAVKVARHRLRKKVGLDKDASLQDFVDGLE